MKKACTVEPIQLSPSAMERRLCCEASPGGNRNDTFGSVPAAASEVKPVLG